MSWFIRWLEGPWTPEQGWCSVLVVGKSYMSRYCIICYCSSCKFKLSFTCRTKAPGTIHWLTTTLVFMLLWQGQRGCSLTLYNCQLMHLPLMTNLIWLYGNTHPCDSSCVDVRGSRWYYENSTFLFVYWQHCQMYLCGSLIFLTTFLFPCYYMLIEPRMSHVHPLVPLKLLSSG